MEINESYLKTLLEEHKEAFEDKDIYSLDDLKSYVASQITSNLQFDFNDIVFDIHKIFEENDGKEEAITLTDEQKIKYNEYLKSQIKDRCNSDGYIEYHWWYDEEVDKQSIQDLFDDNEYSIYDALDEKDWMLDANIQQEDEFIASVIENAPQELKPYLESFNEGINDWDILREDLYDNGYNGVDMNYDTLLEQTEVRVNIFLATESEKNTDMTAIIKSFGNSYSSPDFEYLIETENEYHNLDNALTYVIHQQGYTTEDVYKILLNGKHEHSEPEFIKGVVEDISENTSEARSEFGIYVRMNAKELNELHNDIHAPDKQDKLLSVDKITNVGLFNEWAGTCGYPSNYLEKELVFPVSMISNVQIEGAKQKVGYTMDEVCGLIGSFWQSNVLQEHNPNPIAYEDYNRTLEVIAKEYKEQEKNKDELERE